MSDYATSGYVDNGGVAVHWRLDGNMRAPTLLLLNSIGTDMRLWAGALPILSAHLRVLRIDTRGHGRSSAPAGDYRLEELAADARAVLDATGTKQAWVAGVSLGGMIAIQLALEAPDRVAGLTLICTSATMESAAWSTRVDIVRANGVEAIVPLAVSRFLSPEFVRAQPGLAAAVADGVRIMASDGYAGCAAAIRDMVLRDKLGTIQAPTTVVTGDLDISTPFAGHGDYLVAAIPNAAHIALPCAHLAPIEAPEALAEHLLTLVRI